MANRKFHTVRGYQLLDQDRKLLTPALEDYLEMIYRNSLEEEYIRVNKLAELLNVRASSASKMVQKLALLNFVNYKKYGIILLTDDGKMMGSFLYHRHKTIEAFLELLGGEDILHQTELIEHDINNNTLKKIEIMNQFFYDHEDIKRKFIAYKNRKEKE
ncbi:MAG: DtxR family transcriptional regulator [Clostridia bacterium]|nr:DtxR family transcriptional regulator [Clostridia bacterium]